MLKAVSEEQEWIHQTGQEMAAVLGSGGVAAGSPLVQDRMKNKFPSLE